MNYCPTRRTPRTATLSAAIVVALVPALSAAQEAQDAGGVEATTLDRVQVTGTRIRQVDLETAQPVLILSRQEIEQQGFQSVADILQNITAVGSPPGGLSRAQPLFTGENVGGQFIQMRNLGATRTLILVNGKRLGISTSGLQDISVIPTSMIERVEILKDGASSIYGSDAIAGVVNFITRSGFEGATAGAFYGQQGEGDGETTRADFVVGFSGDRGSVTLGAEYRDEKPVFARDRAFTAFPQTDRNPTRGWTTVSQWGVINLPGALGGNRVLDPDADWRDIANYSPLDCDVGGVPGTVPPECSGSGGAGSTTHKSNPNEQTMLRTGIESTSLFANIVYDLTENVRFRSDLLYAGRQTRLQVAGFPLQTATVTGPFAGMQMSVDSYYNPVGSQHGFAAPQAVNFWRRTWEMPRVDRNQLNTYRFSGGFEGNFELAGRFLDWDAGYLYNRAERVQNNVGNLNLFNVARAVGPSFLNPETGRVECGTPDNPIPFGAGATGCVPWNPFIPFGRVGDGGLTDNELLQSYLFQETRARGLTETSLFTANVSGQLLSLPAGDLGFAFGLEHRREKGEFVPDAMAVNGLTTNLSSGPTRGSYALDEAYLELFVPLLAGIPGAHDLSITAATRYSDFDTFGDTLNSKFGLKWNPVETVLVRGTWAQGFRAPTIADLFGGGSQTFSTYTDPCDTLFGASASSNAVRARCAQDIADADNFRQLAQGFVPAPGPNAQTPVPFNSGANPNLAPETATTRTVGVVWSPGFIEGFNVALDWWKARIGNTIVADNPTQILSDCYIEGIESRCVGFTRDPTTGIVNTLSFGNRNAGYIEVEGFDFDLNYRRGTDFGTFTAAWQSTYASRNEFKTSNDPEVSPQQQVSFGGNFRLQSNLNLGWRSGPWSANWVARYYSAMKEPCALPIALFPDECANPDPFTPGPTGPGPKHRVGSNTFHDLKLRWNAPWEANIGVGVNNVFRRIGPPMYSQPSANVAYQGQFDIGRFVYLEYQQRF